MGWDPKVVYWTAALANMVVAFGFAAAGVARIRRGEVAAHRRAMKTAALLVLLFVVSYVVKVPVLGRERLDTWAPRFVAVLRVHETFVMTMVLAGALALALATLGGLARLGRAAPERRTRTARFHRAAGWTAVATCALGAATAGYVLYGMYARL